ncbi:MAG TPA: DNA methyltransferase, partial [Candidatus Pacearchaeota archaeon]|nr:DNA methyltransferase [Candidatus Pacearchaeota archaeon]
PEELPKRVIKMFSFVGDVVLDPFLGSGTTTVAAKNLNRNSVGYEINERFLPLIKEKVGVDKRELFQNADFEIIKQKPPNIDWSLEIAKLPYIFKDPIKFDKKVDPRKLRFGSKIDLSESKEQEYYSIKTVISPQELVLNNDIKIKLLGIKPKKDVINEAMNFLNSKLKNQKVFIKYDSMKYDNDGNLLVYLYLKNKTFINAHLIKNRLVEVDTDTIYFYKNKFIKLNQIYGERMDFK